MKEGALRPSLVYLLQQTFLWNHRDILRMVKG